MWPDLVETEGLLKRVQSADAAAVEQLWERHREPLRRVIDVRLDHQLGRRVDASDVVQDVLLEANRRLHEYLSDPAVPFQLWLRLIARDHILDQHRRHRGAARRSLDREQPLAAAQFPDQSSIQLADRLRDPGPSPLTEVLRNELARRFHESLRSLDDDDREVILLRHSEQLSNQQAASALGLSEAAAGMRYLRALRRLRSSLGEVPSQSARR
jgi:RNA polymerase sigma-70 factor (ECF subfamily)